MNKKRVLIIQDFSMDEEAVRKYDFLKEYDVELDVVQDAHDISKDEFMNRFLTFETKGPDALPVNEEMVRKMKDADIVISHFSPISTKAIEEARHLEAFLAEHGGWKAFLWKPPYAYRQIKVTCAGWSARVGMLRVEFSAEFKQVVN